MANTSFGSLLKNPLVLGVLATEMTSNLAKSYTDAQNQERAQEALQTQQLDTMAAATGHVATEAPRTGLFGKIGAGLGILSPTTPLKPYQIASEQQAVQGEQKSDLAAVENLVKIRKDLGPEGWTNFKSKIMESGNPEMQKLVRMAPDIPLLPSEKKAMMGQSIDKTVYLPDGSTREVSIPKGVEYNPEAEFGKGATLKTPLKPDKTPEQIKAAATARTEGVNEGKLKSSIFNSPNPYYDTNTGNPVTTSMTQEEARKTGHMIPASPKAIQSYQDSKRVMKELDRLDGIAQRRLPSTRGMSADQAGKAILTSWVTLTGLTKIVNLDNEANDLVYAAQLPAIALIHDIQQRYPSQIELKQIDPLLPGKADSRESFHQKIVRLKAMLSSGINQGAREDAGEIEAKSAEATYNAIVGGED